MEFSPKGIHRSLQIDSLVNVNGVISSPEKASISVFDRGFLYGDSIYEVTQTFSGKLFKLDAHLDRLWHSAAMMDMPITYSREEIISQIQTTVDKTTGNNIYVRIIVTRGEGEIGLDPNLATRNNLIIITKVMPENPKWWYDDGVHMIIAHILRNSKNAVDPNIKSGNYLNNVLAMSEAKKQGAFDAIMLNSDGNITEATTSNIWIIKDGTLITPPIKSGLLGGITRLSLLEIAKDNDLDFRVDNFNVEDLKSSDECFLTSTTKMIVPITKVDDTIIGLGRPGKLTNKLLKMYKNTYGI
jgi:branched-chain amino acid aminotransferase